MANDPKHVPAWQRLGREAVYDGRIFTLTRRPSRCPRTGSIHPFDVIESPDWVNVVPLTRNREVVMVSQYRHGIETVTLEIPGGLVDPSDVSPLEAARRELREETGYDGTDFVSLGAIHPNPAIQDNRCHTFLVRDVAPSCPVSFDGTEETQVVIVPLGEIPSLVRDGTISHALVVVAFHWLLLHESRGA